MAISSSGEGGASASAATRALTAAAAATARSSLASAGGGDPPPVAAPPAVFFLGFLSRDLGGDPDPGPGVEWPSGAGEITPPPRSFQVSTKTRPCGPSRRVMNPIASASAMMARIVSTCLPRT
jgi:hypothetical protein